VWRCGTGTIRISRSGFSALSGPKGNHGETVCELYWYLDATPTGSYARALYKYPQRAFPYDELARPWRDIAFARRAVPRILDTNAIRRRFATSTWRSSTPRPGRRTSSSASR
jgi:hypothetical protein